MANPKPAPAPPEVLFKPGWFTGKTKAVRIPTALEKQVKDIARCLDRKPSIADQVLAYAQSLLDK